MKLLPRLNKFVRPRYVAGLAFLLMVLVIAALWKTGKRQFAYYVLDPIPASVGNIQFENRDFLGISPEPISLIRFTASMADIELILRTKGFKQTEESFDASGPSWWNTARLGPGSRVFVRQHAPKKKTNFYVGKNRRWTEVIRIDNTGTNVYFLVWGI